MASKKQRLVDLRRQVAEIRSELDRMESSSELIVPDIMEFCLSDQYLNVKLYPPQGTLLKVICLQDELFTANDIATIEQWMAGFTLDEVADEGGAETVSTSRHFEGHYGMAPDVMARMQELKQAGRRWFPEVVHAAGRRAGKGRMGAIAGAYVTWCLLALGDPQHHFGIAPAKTLAGLVFAGNFSQARDNQWLDLAEVMAQGRCFAPHLSEVRASKLVLATSADLDRDGPTGRGTIEISARESTVLSARGAAAYMLFVDEAAHVAIGKSKAAAEEILSAATPSLDQCRGFDFAYLASSPWQQTGAFYESYRRGLEVDRHDASAVYPEVLTVQFPSWSLYEGWQTAGTTRTVPETAVSSLGPYESHAPELTYFAPLKTAIQEYDDRLRQRERRDPVSFDVEYRALWAHVADPFLPASAITAMFAAYNGVTLRTRHEGVLSTYYVAAGDPASRHDNFAWLIAHREGPDEHGLHHVIVDKMTVWRPQDFADGIVDFLQVTNDMVDDLKAFGLAKATFDQHQAISIVQTLRKRAAELSLPRRFEVADVAHTAASNRQMFATLHQAIVQGRVHAPANPLMEDELRFLRRIGDRVDHPASGSKDLADCLAVVCEDLLGLEAGVDVHEQLSESQLHATDADQRVFDALGRSLRRPRFSHGAQKYKH